MTAATPRPWHADSRPSWHHPKIVTVLLLVFFCGVLAGALAFRWMRTTVRPVHQGLRMDQLQRELKLSPQQAREVQSALDDYVLYYQNLQGQMEDIRAQGHTRIMKILDPEQQRKFESMGSELSGRSR